jgi:hypothetical protein
MSDLMLAMVHLAARHGYFFITLVLVVIVLALAANSRRSQK